MAPSLAVLLTWIVASAWLVLLGGFGGVQVVRQAGWISALRVSLWLGLAVLVLSLMSMNLVTALRSGAAVTMAVVISITTSALGIIAIFVSLRTGDRGIAPRVVRGITEPWTLPVIGACGLAALAAAHAAFGDVANWDAGLYHLNAAQYTANYATIPGLANLNDRLGTNTSTSLIAGFLQNTPWGADAFRLVTGLFVLLVVVELCLRLLDPRKGTRRLPGTALLAVTAAVALSTMLSDSAMWLTNPNPDAVAMLIILVSAAYLLDALTTGSTAWAAVAVITAVTAATVRSPLWAMAGATIAAVFVDRLRRRRVAGRARPRLLASTVAVLAVLLLGAQLVRDMLLSGWLLFPATWFPVPVDWRVADPSVSRAWIISWARDPSSTPEQTLSGLSWIGGWLSRTIADPVVLQSLAILGAVLLLSLWARHHTRFSRWRSQPAWIALAIAPSLAYLLTWLGTAPDPRFAYGPILVASATIAVFELAAFTRAMRMRPAIWRASAIACAAFLLLTVPAVITALVQATGSAGQGTRIVAYDFGPTTVVAAVAPLPTPTVTGLVLDGGQQVFVPTEGDRCWTTFPLCTPSRDTRLEFRGATIAEGFRPGP